MAEEKTAVEAENPEKLPVEEQAPDTAEVKPEEDPKKSKKDKKNKKAEKDKKPKKPLWKRLLRIFIIVFVVLAALVILRDLLIKHAVEKGGTFLVGTPVKVGYFSSSLIGKVHIKNLTVGNPEGYNNPHAFKLGEVRVHLNIPSLFTDKIEVKEVYVEGVNVDYELKFGRSNLGEIQNNLERFQPEKKDDDKDEPEEDDAAQKQAVIRLLKVENTSLSFSNSALGTTVALPLPGLNLENLGDGKPIGETVNDLFGLIFTSVRNAVTGIGGFIGDTASATGSAISDAASATGNAISNSAQSVGKSVKKLFE